MNINFGDISAAGLRELADGLEDNKNRRDLGISNLPIFVAPGKIDEAIKAYRAEADRLSKARHAPKEV